MADLDKLRARIDLLDRQLIAVIAERLQVCRDIASVKEDRETPIIQPERVRDVVTSRRQQAIEAHLDPDFVEQMFRVLLTETHRIEVAGQHPNPPPDKVATGQFDETEVASALDTVATRVDHVVVAVTNLAAARDALVARFGFHERPMAGGAVPGVAALVAGGVTLVLISADASPFVARYLRRHGPGVQHVAIEVLNAGYARSALAERGAPLLTEVVVDPDGHEQFFAADHPAIEVQLGFISRTGHRVELRADNVLALFQALAAGADD